MFHLPVRLAAALIALLALPSCRTTTAYEWGTKEDPEWTGRIGQATFQQVVAEHGRPFERVDYDSGDFKARWPGTSISFNTEQGTMNDESLTQREERTIWRDMLFEKSGTLLRAWLTSQRELAASNPP